MMAGSAAVIVALALPDTVFVVGETSRITPKSPLGLGTMGAEIRELTMFHRAELSRNDTLMKDVPEASP
jgi:hypothetical protein